MPAPEHVVRPALAVPMLDWVAGTEPGCHGGRSDVGIDGTFGPGPATAPGAASSGGAPAAAGEGHPMTARPLTHLPRPAPTERSR